MYGRRRLPELVGSEKNKKTTMFCEIQKSFFFDFCVSKITPSPIPINKGGFTGGFEKDLHFVYKISTIEKTSSTYTHKNGVLRTLLRAMFTVCLQKDRSHKSGCGPVPGAYFSSPLWPCEPV